MGDLRRKAWHGLAVVGFAAGALAGAALGGGLPADLITTALPTVSTPITTVTTPTISTPTSLDADGLDADGHDADRLDADGLDADRDGAHTGDNRCGGGPDPGEDDRNSAVRDGCRHVGGGETRGLGARRDCNRHCDRRGAVAALERARAAIVSRRIRAAAVGCRPGPELRARSAATCRRVSMLRAFRRHSRVPLVTFLV